MKTCLCCAHSCTLPCPLRLHALLRLLIYKFVAIHFPLISSLILSLLPSSSSCQTELLIVAGSASAPTTPSTPSTPRAASFSPRLKNRRVRLLLSLFESPALCVMLTHLCEDLSVLCSLMHFAVPSASACVAPASCLGVSQHHHHCTESSNQSALLYSDYIWELSSDSNYYKYRS